MTSKVLTDTLQITYKILYALEHKKRGEPMRQQIGPEALGANPMKWEEALEGLIKEGLVKGVQIESNVRLGYFVGLEHARITLKGAEYLFANETLA